MKTAKKTNILIFVLMLWASSSFAQSDSAYGFNYDDFINVVKRFHPVMQQADLMLAKADAELLGSRGAFDPVFSFDSEQKTFDGKSYYQTTNPQLKIPTWYGVEVKTGMQYFAGDNLNPDVTLGQSTYLGISVPLARNLLLDKRRAQLQQARLFRTQSTFERSLLINELLREASVAYWEWVKAQLSVRILQDALKANEARYSLVLNSVNIGERAAIDTVEALTQLNQIRLNFLDARNKSLMTAAELSNYLWKKENQPYQLPAIANAQYTLQNLSVSNLNRSGLDEILQDAAVNHPKIKATQQKLLSLIIEKKLKYQDLLPIINLNANLLNKGYRYSFSKYGTEYARENNKFGLDIYIPLRLSKERAGYKMSKIKITETNLGLDLTKNQVTNKITYYYRELEGLINQVERCEALLKQTRQLFSAEELKFRSGESSQFMINARETKVLEVELKLAELKVKAQQAAVNLNWAAAKW
jgi:outer membrane protein TolC